MSKKRDVPKVILKGKGLEILLMITAKELQDHA